MFFLARLDVGLSRVRRAEPGRRRRQQGRLLGELWVAATVLLGSNTCEHDDSDAYDLQERGGLGKYDEPNEHTECRFN